jgi:hypothetical protein
VKAKVIRALRNQRGQRDRHKGNGIDELLAHLSDWEASGGVGKIQYSNMEICGIQFQHPLIRAIAKQFGVVTTIDGTHNTTKHDKSTLLACTCQDSFGSMCSSGAAWARSECEASMQQSLQELGLADILETLITDASKASFAVVRQFKCGHILCSYHYRKHLCQASHSFTRLFIFAFFFLFIYFNMYT